MRRELYLKVKRSVSALKEEREVRQVFTKHGGIGSTVDNSCITFLIDLRLHPCLGV